MSVIQTAIGRVESVAEHASHPGYRAITWRRTDNYSEAGMQPMPMWVREANAPKVGDTIRVTVELTTGAQP